MSPESWLFSCRETNVLVLLTRKGSACIFGLFFQKIRIHDFGWTWYSNSNVCMFQLRNSLLKKCCIKELLSLAAGFLVCLFVFLLEARFVMCCCSYQEIVWNFIFKCTRDGACDVEQHNQDVLQIYFLFPLLFSKHLYCLCLMLLYSLLLFLLLLFQ